MEALGGQRAAAGSRLSVAASTSANTTRAPRSANALAVETNVNAGTITSSPGPTSSNSAASSSAWVHDVVSSTGRSPSRAANSAAARRVNGPSPRQ